jgi:predicted Zn-dependent protease
MPEVSRDALLSAAAALARDPAEAERKARGLLAHAPDDPSANLILAGAMRRQGRPGEALPLVSEVVRRRPQLGRARLELGLCRAALGQGREALADLDEAVRLNPASAEAWQALADLAVAQADAEREARARAALARIEFRDPRIAGWAEAIAMGRHADAEPGLARHVQAHPDDVDAMRLLAQCHIAHRVYGPAENLLRQVLALRPDFRRARYDLASLLFVRQQAEAALNELAPLLAADPQNPAYRNLQAGCLFMLGDEPAAVAIYENLTGDFPSNVRVFINMAHTLRTGGYRERAIAAYRRVIELRPQTGEAWWGLANLKIGLLTEADEARMGRLLAENLDEGDRRCLEYALGRRCEDAGNPADAFAHYAAGAKLARRRFAPRPIDYAARTLATTRLFTAELLASHAGKGADSAAPIFVVGLPRSGSTLVEQILASHPDIEGTKELPYLGALAARLVREGWMSALSRAAPAQFRAWGEDYLAEAEAHRSLGRPRFIDKTPNNFQHIGLIRLILPNARVIDVRRNPMASCFSVFKELFAEGHEYSYDLTDLAAYYRHYLAVVRHFHQAAPGSVHTLIYEDLVEDTEGEVRRLLAAVGVRFDPACLDFHANDRAVRTVSSEQVRQPIYRSGLDHWRRFEPWLGPLAEGLGNERETWRA